MVYFVQIFCKYISQCEYKGEACIFVNTQRSSHKHLDMLNEFMFILARAVASLSKGVNKGGDRVYSITKRRACITNVEFVL